MEEAKSYIKAQFKTFKKKLDGIPILKNAEVRKTKNDVL